jgi:quinol-cytochrome oxidoreductase complex cytochrome b subunit
MLLVPGLIAALIGAHLYLVAKLGTTAPPWMKAEEPESCTRSAYEPRGEGGLPPRVRPAEGQGKPFFPYAVAKDSLMACIVMFTIILLSIVLGAELGRRPTRPRPPTCRGRSGTSSSSSSCCA